ncbi:hypothetical protein BJ138DRAFT_310041 [Hygrophoropsis aurantiaca]|uniref:Uncharacterized protein n=1 Tax=Hygrophoropsis aurantiaca TaxID=72124 RepID=A0ACB8A6V9_9AGAM|nr:hypothetical protein BJ138DRAFT_310041 [Hygrophoropsis aurantiaca]
MTSRLVPLENNPEVLNKWANAAGLVETQFQFCEVYGLDPEAVVLLYPGNIDAIAHKSKLEDENISVNGQYPIHPSVTWVKQTISNACGTMAVLHSLCNSGVPLIPQSLLEKFIQDCKGKTPLECSKILEETHRFTEIHKELAVDGQSRVPADLNVEFHFTSFVQAPDVNAQPGETKLRMVELNGARNCAIDRGESNDLLADVAEYVKTAQIAHVSSIHFSMMALAPVEQ